MKVYVKTFGQLRRLVGSPSHSLDVSQGAMLIDVVEQLASEFGPGVRDNLFSEGKLSGFYSLMVDGEVYETEEEYATQPLVDGQTVVILPHIGGG